MKKTYIIIPATIVSIVIIFFLWKIFHKDPPCETIFQQTAVQLTASLKVLEQTGGISIGDQRIQELTEKAQIVALNLKTCCIENMDNKISAEQFLKCQQMGDQYDQQVKDLAKNVDIIDRAKKNGDSSTMNQTLIAVNSQLTNLQQSVQQITGIAGKINLINIKNGGHIIAAPADYWDRTIDSLEDEFTITCENCEGIYGFKNGRSATFDMFCMLIPKASLNVKDFALFYGNDSPTGQFQPIDHFQTQNVRLFDTPYQQFKFPAVTAKYFKVKIISYWGNAEGFVYEFQLWGTLK